MPAVKFNICKNGVITGNAEGNLFFSEGIRCVEWMGQIYPLSDTFHISLDGTAPRNVTETASKKHASNLAFSPYDDIFGHKIGSAVDAPCGSPAIVCTQDASLGTSSVSAKLSTDTDSDPKDFLTSTPDSLEEEMLDNRMTEPRELDEQQTESPDEMRPILNEEGMWEEENEVRPPLNSVQTLTWTSEQQRVIEASPESRLLVDAGPGTGKTATACARIAWLIKNGGLEASEIWLFSFTRTAVHELRSRIASFLDNPGEVAALRIVTVDSYAWAVHSGFDSQASLNGTFDDNIKRVIELVRTHEGVFEYLSTIRHLVVDEAQDVMGLRCELLLEIIYALPQKAGVSVFSDEAQSIYGFAEDSSHATVAGTLPENIREYMADQFGEHELNQVHRTTSGILLEVFRDGRNIIRSKKSSGAEHLESVRKLVEQNNHGLVGKYWDDIKQLPADQTDTLLLFRRRGEALTASGDLGTRPHRLRMSGLPICIQGWIAVLLWDWTKPDLDFDEFERLWKERLGPTLDIHANAAWLVLVKAFGRSASRISVTRLVTKLASGSPSFELSLPEFGYAGPIISTIHGSKGREADEVRLYLPSQLVGNTADDELDEEARIVFVGATRARRLLRVGSAKSKSVSRRLKPSGRAFTPMPFKGQTMVARARVEVGRVRDIDAVGLVGKNLYGSASVARDAQARVIALGSGMACAHASGTNEEAGWRFKVELEDNQGHLCYLSKALDPDLFEIARYVDKFVQLGKNRPPSQLKYLHTFGVRTLAVAPDETVRAQLHAPWCDSGLIAAPMLMGYSMAYFR